MKELMSGNDALARGLYEAGCKLVSSYPGTPSTEITESAALYSEIDAEWAPNEKVAMEVAFGASLAGARSFCGMKHVGLNVAADPLFTISYTGVNGGMIIAVADDPGMHSSQNEQDSRNYAKASKIPMLEPSDSAEALVFAARAYELSEQYDTPILMRMCTRIAHSRSIVETSPRKEVPLRDYEKKPEKYIMMPAYAKRRHPVVEARTAALTELAESDPINFITWGDKRLGVITSGTSYQYVREALGDSVSILKLGMVYPLPVQKILDFASQVDRLAVVEELDPFIETHVRALGLDVIGKDTFSMIGELSVNTVKAALGTNAPEVTPLNETLPMRPPAMCAGCPHRGLFYTLSKKKLRVLGDIGCYTLGAQAPLSAMDATICMGASVSSLHGFNKVRGEESTKNTVAVIGDSTFMHSGMTGLVNVSYNATNSTVIILDNSITGMTGHQENPTTGKNLKGEVAAKVDLEALCHALGIRRVRVVDPYDLAACDAAVTEELAADEPSVIISRRPCVLLKSVKPAPALKVDTDKCKSCRACMKIGCPAISMKDGRAFVDNTLCTGCGVCRQLCRFDAFASEA